MLSGVVNHADSGHKVDHLLARRVVQVVAALVAPVPVNPLQTEPASGSRPIRHDNQSPLPTGTHETRLCPSFPPPPPSPVGVFPFRLDESSGGGASRRRQSTPNASAARGGQRCAATISRRAATRPSAAGGAAGTALPLPRLTATCLPARASAAAVPARFPRAALLGPLSSLSFLSLGQS